MTTTTTTQARVPSVTRVIRPVTLLVIGWVIASLEGYDLAVFGASIPAIVTDRSLGVDKIGAGAIGSLVAIGMLAGAGLAGALVHRMGPRALIIGSVGLFSAGMVLSAVAPDSTLFGAGRLVTGLGLGIVMPTLNSYVADLSTPGRRNRNIATVMSGYAFGGLSAPLLASVLLPHGAYRWLYLIGVVPAIAIVPFLLRLPESPVHLLNTGRRDRATALNEHFGLPEPTLASGGAAGRWFGLAQLLRRDVLAVTILFWVMCFCGLLLVFGITTWLPSMMQAAGYPLGSALLQTAMMWLGVGCGVIAGGRVADAIGPKRVVIVAFLVSSASLVLISTGPAVALLYLLMFVAGFGFIGAQMLVNGFIATRYPDDLRGNGLAWALSVGRFGAIAGPSLGAFILASSLSVRWNFLAFAIPGLIGATAAVLVPMARKKAGGARG
ncbi:MFS transporter [Streptomyces sp. NBC_01537]|uniref:MFS transporter n=1 Tax=Streptomyces sp. NBC_01537 TaxID=2903896 RepID=UPI00386E916F